MKIYNTLTAKLEEFVPVSGYKKVGMYVCGPTVYDLAHLGHGRSAVVFDVIRRYLTYQGFAVNFVSNYTDIDDKMIQRAEKMGISVPELAEKIIPEYVQDYDALGILRANENPRATDFVKEMIELIELLEGKGATYLLNDGVYFDISSFADYGKLSKQKMDELQSGTRVKTNDGKRNHQDFVLWKLSKPGEPSWPSPWGEGRPGWHIECSAMAEKILGQPFDIHGGGADLIFPHHECEIAQSEKAYGKEFAKVWIHNGFIRVDNEKMSKSLGNFFLLRDIFKKFDPQVVRFFFLQTHYRSPIDFSDVVLQQAKNGLERLHDFAARLQKYEPTIGGEGVGELNQDLNFYDDSFSKGLDNDFDTAEALAVCFDLVKKVNHSMDAQNLSAISKNAVLEKLQKFDQVLGVIFSTSVQTVSAETMDLIRQREEARAAKNWAESDRLRDELLKLGIKIEDTSKGTVWKRV